MTPSVPNEDHIMDIIHGQRWGELASFLLSPLDLFYFIDYNNYVNHLFVLLKDVNSVKLNTEMTPSLDLISKMC